MEHCDPSTSTADAPPPLSSSQENDHQIAEQADRDEEAIIPEEEAAIIPEEEEAAIVPEEEEAIIPEEEAAIIPEEEEEAIIPEEEAAIIPEEEEEAIIPATSPRNLIDLHGDILETIFLRVPSHYFQQISTTCKEVDALLKNSICLRRQYIEEFVQREEIIIPVRLNWESRAALYKNRYSKRVSWKLGSNLGSCYYRCYNTREISSRRDHDAESPTPIPCHGGLFCPWIECGRWHRWFDGGVVRTFLRNRAQEFENSNERRPSAHQLCSVCSNPRPASSLSCMVSSLHIKNPITGIYKRLPFVNGIWTSKLKCIVTYDRDHFRVLIAMPAETGENRAQINIGKTMIYDSVIDSWREIRSRSRNCLENITDVVDTHGVYCRGAMYWLLRAPRDLIVFNVEKESWEILKARKQPPPGDRLGLVACKDQLLMAEALHGVLIIWKLSVRNSLDQSPNERGEWLEISRSTEEICQELRNTEMAVHSASSPDGDGFICFENLVKRTAVTYNVRTGTWGRSNEIHAV